MNQHLPPVWARCLLYQERVSRGDVLQNILPLDAIRIGERDAHSFRAHCRWGLGLCCLWLLEGGALHIQQ